MGIAAASLGHSIVSFQGTITYMIFLAGAGLIFLGLLNFLGKGFSSFLKKGKKSRDGRSGVFLMGIFWKRTTANGALGIAIGSAVFSLIFKFAWPELPFIDRVGWVFVLCIVTGVVISMIQGAEKHPDAIEYRDVDTATTSGFNWAALGIILMLAALYVTWW